MNRRIRDNSALVKKYKSEPKVKVLGSTMFQQYCGDRYTFTFNGFPVSIDFDGEYHEFPQTIAKVVERKLKEIAEANSPKKVNTQVYY